MTVHDSLHSLLDHESLLFHCDEWLIIAHTLNSPTAKLRPFYNFQTATI
jgi:hypothetical protein